jgi:adenine C2-methylase RlmN of 23S rRNA A2503 and tRNA A37
MPGSEHAVICLSDAGWLPLIAPFAPPEGWFKRNLSAGEIVDQVIYFRRLKPQILSATWSLWNGEPLLNYANSEAIKRSRRRTGRRFQRAYGFTAALPGIRRWRRGQAKGIPECADG